MNTPKGDDWTNVNNHILYRDTLNKLNDLRHRVLDGQDIMLALEFARFVEASFIVRILKPFDNDGPLTVDSKALQARAKEVRQLAQDTFYKLGKEELFPRHDAEQIAGINRRLDILAAQVSKLTTLLSPALLETGVETAEAAGLPRAARPVIEDGRGNSSPITAVTT